MQRWEHGIWSLAGATLPFFNLRFLSFLHVFVFTHLHLAKAGELGLELRWKPPLGGAGTPGVRLPTLGGGRRHR